MPEVKASGATGFTDGKSKASTFLLLSVTALSPSEAPENGMRETGRWSGDAQRLSVLDPGLDGHQHSLAVHGNCITNTSCRSPQ